MENYFVYNDPIRIVWRKGNSEEPYVDKVESQKVINNMVVLTEIPDEFTHVSIDGYTEIYEGTPSVDQFIVNYENGVITFNPSKEGSTIVNMTYKGRGFILYPASRIYGHNENPDVIVTLQQIIDAGDIALDALAKLVVVIANAEAATAKAITQADYAKAQGDYAKAQGDYSKASGDALVFKGTYAGATAYVARNMVYYNGATYMCIANTTGNLPTNGTYWKKIGNMIYKGTYAAATAYTYGDFVVDATNYNLYMSINEVNTGQALTNATYWVKMISVQSVVDATVLATTNANTATTQANNARDAANAAKAAADTATGLANTATSNANTATTQANTARDGANAAAIAANTAKTNADTARDAANAAAAAANTAKTNADTATGLANAATSAANTATGLANTATTQANTARDGANTARDAANAAATAANTAKTNADTATTQANAARDAANTAATNANTKADYAQTQGNYAKDVGDSLVHKGDYNATLAYVVRNLVYYNGVTYMCIANSAAGVLPTNATYWKKIVAFNWKGTYSNSTTYQYGDFVVDATNQKLYICVKDGTINTAFTVVANWNPIFDISTVIASANTAITQANAARDAANLAKTNADTATTQANAARDAANTAKTNADAAALEASTQGDYAKTQGDYAKAQGNAASTATTAANTATTQANTARDAANIARDTANAATAAANTATTNANNAATAANTAKTNADTATGLANTATTNANNAATNANTVAGRTSAKGTYSASTTYYPNNIVTYNGSSYMCTVQALNKVPTDTGFWQLVALKGNDGLGSVANIVSTNGDLNVTGTSDTPNLSISTSLKTLWGDKYTKTEIDTLLNQATSNIQWKASVATYAAIATTYPNPQDGWTVNVNDTDYTYRYTGSAWIAISANSIPNASASSDGKMSIALFNKLTAISAQATRTINSTTNGNILIDGVENNVYAHPTGAGNNHIPTGGAANNFLKYSASGTAVWATPTLSGLAETVIASPVNAQVLKYNGTNWVNSALTFADIGNGTSTGVLVPNFNADMVDGFHVSSSNLPNTIVARDSLGTISVAKVLSTTLRTGSYFQKHLGIFTTTQSVAYEKIDIIFSAPLAGYLDVVITGAYGYQQAFGQLRKRFSVYTGAEGNIYSPETSYVETIGAVAFTHAISDLFYDSLTKTFRIRISKLQIASGNAISVYIEGLAQGNGYADNFETATLSTISTGDTTTPDVPVRTFNYKTIFSGQVILGSAQGTAPLAVTSTTLVPNFNADMVDGYHLDQDVRSTAKPTFGGITAGTSIFGATPNDGVGFVRLTSGASGAYVQAIDAAKTGSTTLWLTGFAAATTTVRTINNVLDNGSGGFSAGSVTAGVLISTAAQGTAPLVVTSTTVVPNLSADTVDGFHMNQALLTTSAPNFTGMGLNGNLYMSSSAPIIEFNETDQALNEKKWWIVPDSKMLQIRTITDAGGSGITALSINRGTGTAIASITVNAPLSSSVPQGTAPLVVASTTLVTNFNADLLDGYHTSTVDVANTVAARDTNGNIVAKQFSSTVTQGGKPFYIISTTLNDNLNADMVDGFHLDQDLRVAASPTFGSLKVSSGSGCLSLYAGGTTDHAYMQFYARTATPSLRTAFVGFGAAAVNNFNISNEISGGNIILSTIGGGRVVADVYQSNAAPGTAPFVVTSPTTVPSLSADMVDSYHAAPASGANLIPVRDANKKIAEVSATRANIAQVAVPTSNTPINMISYAAAVKANFTVYAYLTIKEVSTVEVKITYSDNGGPNSQTIYVQPSKTLTPDSYSYLPVYFTAIPVGTISVVVTSNNSSATLVSATIKEE